MANETSKATSPGNASPTPQQIPLAQIRDLPGIVNIRTYTPKDLGGLVSSIQSVGVREPIIVRRSEDGMYQLLAGQRRRKASELAKKTTIPALVYEMALEEARSYHKAQALDPKAVIPGKLVTLSAGEPSKAEEKTPVVPADDKDKQNEKPTPTAPIKSEPTKAEEKTPVVPVVVDKGKETEKSAPVAPAKNEAVKAEEKSAATPAEADKSKEAEKPAAATPAKSEPAKTEGKMSATPAATDKGKGAEKSAPAASTKAAPAKPAAMPAGPAAVGPTGTAITQVFEARLNPPDEKALKDLPIPKEGESYFITLHPAYLERSKYNNFSVDKDSDNFKELYKAVELAGIKDPVLARPKEGGGLEILSGQRRHLIGTELNYPIPTIIQRIDDADAKILVADSNLHRDKISTYDLSRALKMKMEGMKQKAGRKKKGELGEKLNTDEAIAKEMGITVSKFNRMLRMSEATKDVCSKVDDGTLALAYRFTAYQKKALAELLDDSALLDALLYDLDSLQYDAAMLRRALPRNLSKERRAVVERALSLAGKVNYFWGGKSLVFGWDDRWGQLAKVTADGSSTTGTYRPYGLDCSGMVDWAFYNATNGSYVIGHGGGAAMQHSYCTPVRWEDAQIGDLAFYPDDEHVGIVAGWDKNGIIQIVHCASSYNNVVITGKEGFAAVGHPIYYTND